MELVLKTTEEGCIVPTSHKLNPDGYFRKNINGKLIMYHRYVWFEAGHEIPEGYEIDHLCKNRACCNLEHLRCITRKQHLRETNEQRYAPRQAEAKEYWKTYRPKGVELAAKFGVSFSIGCRWIRKWKQEENPMTLKIPKKLKPSRQSKVAKQEWKNNNSTPEELAKKFNVSISTAYRWIKQWKEEQS